LLSRAQHGMYIIRNAETARPVTMWNNVLHTLEQSGNIGPTLALCCPRHMETSIEVSNADDFPVFSPEGGCNLHCTWRLDCGHPCVHKCHSKPLHDSVYCMQPCRRIRTSCHYPCSNVCGDRVLKNVNRSYPISRYHVDIFQKHSNVMRYNPLKKYDAKFLSRLSCQAVITKPRLHVIQ